jgi:hypothetical protein
MPADFDRLVDELEERLARSAWSVSRGPNSVTIAYGAATGAPGSGGWSFRELTAAYDGHAGLWVVTDSADAGKTTEIARVATPAEAIGMLDMRAGS